MMCVPSYRSIKLVHKTFERTLEPRWIAIDQRVVSLYGITGRWQDSNVNCKTTSTAWCLLSEQAGFAVYFKSNLFYLAAISRPSVKRERSAWFVLAAPMQMCLGSEGVVWRAACSQSWSYLCDISCVVRPVVGALTECMWWWPCKRVAVGINGIKL